MKVIAVVGSIRKESYNLNLAQYMQKRYKSKLDIEIASIKELPLYNEDIESNPPETVTKFIKK